MGRSAIAACLQPEAGIASLPRQGCVAKQPLTASDASGDDFGGPGWATAGPGALPDPARSSRPFPHRLLHPDPSSPHSLSATRPPRGLDVEEDYGGGAEILGCIGDMDRVDGEITVGAAHVKA